MRRLEGLRLRGVWICGSLERRCSGGFVLPGGGLCLLLLSYTIEAVKLFPRL